MQAPQPPIDISICMGQQQDAQNLIDININFSDRKQDVAKYLQGKKLGNGFGKDCVLIFDLYTEPKQEKQAIKYFQESGGKSPLQIVFSNRPESEEFCKFSLEQHEGFVRIIYQFLLQQKQIQGIGQILNSFSQNNLKLQSNINLCMKGKVSHTNKNRTNVLVNYTKFHLVSNAFCSQNLMNSLLSFNDFQNNFEYYINNPFFSLIKKSKTAKINIKMDSFRKISKYFNKVAQEPKQKQQKEFKYTNRGIFRQRATGTLIYGNSYLIDINGKFESEDVFIRLVKVYSKFFESVLNTAFYDDD